MNRLRQPAMSDREREDGDLPPLPPGVDPAVWRANVKAAAERALAEAEARRRAADARARDAAAGKGPREIGGPEGPEPTRFGDWERKGIATDF